MLLGRSLDRQTTRLATCGHNQSGCSSVFPSWPPLSPRQRTTFHHASSRQSIPRSETQRHGSNMRAQASSTPGQFNANGASQQSPSSECAVVIVDHGSRRAESNEQLQQFAELYRQHSGRDAVSIAHMEIASPSIGDAVADLAQQGYREVVIAPYFLSNGRHISQDIPALVAEAQKAHPSVHCRVADPIGVDPLMAKIIEQRVVSSLQQSLQDGSTPVPATAVTIEKE